MTAELRDTMNEPLVIVRTGTVVPDTTIANAGSWVVVGVPDDATVPEVATTKDVNGAFSGTSCAEMGWMTELGVAGNMDQSAN